MHDEIVTTTWPGVADLKVISWTGVTSFRETTRNLLRTVHVIIDPDAQADIAVVESTIRDRRHVGERGVA